MICNQVHQPRTVAANYLLLGPPASARRRHCVEVSIVVLILDENFAATVGGDTPLDKRQNDLEPSLKGSEPRRFEYRRNRVTVECLAELLRQRAALDRQQVVVRRFA